MARLKPLAQLRTFILGKTAVTDAGLKHLENLRNLTTLNVKSTKVTAEGINKLRLRVASLQSPMTSRRSSGDSPCDERLTQTAKAPRGVLSARPGPNVEGPKKNLTDGPVLD